MTTAERIKQRRKDLGLRAEDVAERIGVSRSTMFRYEMAKSKSSQSIIWFLLQRRFIHQLTILWGGQKTKKSLSPWMRIGSIRNLYGFLNSWVTNKKTLLFVQ